jgi:hypothetical protein
MLSPVACCFVPCQSAVLNFTYDGTSFRRGLVIDKERGNVIKMDRHKYVRQVRKGAMGRYARAVVWCGARIRCEAYICVPVANADLHVQVADTHMTLTRCGLHSTVPCSYAPWPCSYPLSRRSTGSLR